MEKRLGREPITEAGAPCSLSRRSAARATATGCTDTAPADRRARAPDSSVAPVVSVSSTNKTRRPDRSHARGTRKAPITLERRRWRARLVCGAVSRVRVNALFRSGMPSVSASPRAIHSDWLYPRSSRRSLSSGMGTIQSQASSNGGNPDIPSSFPRWRPIHGWF